MDGSWGGAEGDADEGTGGSGEGGGSKNGGNGTINKPYTLYPIP
jgi:hypothetical protein